MVSIGNKVVRLRETSLFSDTNLVSYWPLDGNANDIKGSNHGIPTGSCDFGAIGKFDKSCGFNGTTSGIVTTNNIGISGDAIFTISCWAKFDTNTTVKIVDCGVNGSATGFCIMYNIGGTISAFFYNSNFVTTTESFSTSIWHHIAVTRTTGFANNAKIYVDGIYRKSVVAGMTTANITNTTLSIGYGKTVGGYYVDGNIDDIAYFNRVLTADEIFLLYTGCQNREFIGNRFYISPQAGKSSVELIPYQVDRDFSGANHWTNINFPIFNSSGDLSLGSQANLYRECNIAQTYIPFILGKTFIISFTASNIVGTWELWNADNSKYLYGFNSNGIHETSASWGNATGGIRIKSTSTYGSVDLDNFSVRSAWNDNDGLISYYRFEGNSTDSKGINDGTGTAITYNASYGKFGQGASFDGSTSEIVLGSWFTFQNFTISLWVNPNGTQNAYADIFDNNHTGHTNFVCQQQNTSTNVYSMGATDGTNWSSVADFTLISGIWQHIAFTFDGHYMRGYLNGILFSTGGYISSILYTTQNFRIGNWGLDGRHWKGYIDELLIFNKTLTSREIKSIYQSK